MRRTFEEAMKHRRSYYALGNDAAVQDEEVVHAVREALKHIPSAFNSQSTRIVLLLGEHHRAFWELVKSTLRPLLAPTAYAATEAKIERSFAGGQGTVLFFEDTATVEKLQQAYPAYSDRFPTWAQHTSAMHQFAVWTLIEELGLGASLQHYNPLVDKAVRLAWNLPSTWLLTAQMPFGTPLDTPEVKETDDLSPRIRIFT